MPAEAAPWPDVRRVRLQTKLRQLGDIHRDPPSFILAEQLSRGSATGLILVIDIGELLPAVILHDEGGINVLDRPARREAAGGGVTNHEQMNGADFCEIFW